MSQIRNVAILGSTGSIGRAALDVLSKAGPSFRLSAISCHSQLALFEEQIKLFAPKSAFATGPTDEAAKHWQTGKSQTVRELGMERLVALVSSDEVDIVIAAIVGIEAWRQRSPQQTLENDLRSPTKSRLWFLVP